MKFTCLLTFRVVLLWLMSLLPTRSTPTNFPSVSSHPLDSTRPTSGPLPKTVCNPDAPVDERVVCENGSYCVVQGDGVSRCVCPDGFRGLRCEQVVQPTVAPAVSTDVPSSSSEFPTIAPIPSYPILTFSPQPTAESSSLSTTTTATASPSAENVAFAVSELPSAADPFSSLLPSNATTEVPSSHDVSLTTVDPTETPSLSIIVQTEATALPSNGVSSAVPLPSESESMDVGENQPEDTNNQRSPETSNGQSRFPVFSSIVIIVQTTAVLLRH